MPQIARIVLVFTIIAPSAAATRDLLGPWVNVDPDTRGITRVQISRQNGKFFVQAWGSCSPQDCDWGRVVARAYSGSISTTPDADAHTVRASFPTGFQNTVLLLTLDGPLLRGESLTVFTDNSGRSNYASSHRFQRSNGRTAGGERPVVEELETLPAPAVILHPNGSVERRYGDGKRVIVEEGSITTHYPDGRSSKASFINAPPGEPPPLPSNPNHRLWLEAHSESLLEIIRRIAGDAMTEEYVAGYETDLSLFEKMRKRAWLISALASDQ